MLACYCYIAGWFSNSVVCHSVQLGLKVGDQYRLYVGVDNLTDELPPLGTMCTGAGSGIYNSICRYFYAGIRIRM